MLDTGIVSMRCNQYIWIFILGIWGFYIICEDSPWIYLFLNIFVEVQFLSARVGHIKALKQHWKIEDFLQQVGSSVHFSF